MAEKEGEEEFKLKGQQEKNERKQKREKFSRRDELDRNKIKKQRGKKG